MSYANCWNMYFHESFLLRERRVNRKIVSTVNQLDLSYVHSRLVRFIRLYRLLLRFPILFHEPRVMVELTSERRIT